MALVMYGYIVYKEKKTRNNLTIRLKEGVLR